MKIIITEYFEKVFKKVCKDIDLDFLLNKIKVDSKNFILFKEPFFKVKVRTESKSYRLILNYEKDYMTIILVDIFDKKDKKI
ncbi:TPA: hypothetical protein DCZ31_04105 [Patescibacteria group bacterium]|nr:hypothetical protein [Candidatus Gracilibacteria bacterium]